MRSNLRNTSFVLALSCLFCGTATADLLTFDLNTEFSGASSPAGSGPWLRATFEDVTDGVELTLQSLLTEPSEHIKAWYFNFSSDLNVALLSFQFDSIDSTGPPAIVWTGEDTFKADGDGLYDVRLNWNQPKRVPFGTSAAGLDDRFDGEDEVVYMITSTEAGFSALSFDFLSVPAGGNGPFVTAAHIGGVGDGGNDSGWVTVPAPGAALLGVLGLGLVGLGTRRIF